MLNREEIVKNIKSDHLILKENGDKVILNLDDEKNVLSSLNKLGNKEIKAYLLSEEMPSENSLEPPSIKEMQRLEYVDYEPSSDSGHFRMYPNGQLIFDLLKDWVDYIAKYRLQAMQIESPIIYNWADKEIQEQAGSFHERHYIVRVPDDDSKEFILRFAGDFGLFKMLKDANFSYKMLPLRIYEFSKSFRYEKKGELSGLKRLRAFHMPDIHCFCENLDQGIEEYKNLYKNYIDLANGIGIKYAVAVRVVKDFYEKYEKDLIELASYSNAPVFVEILSDMKHYWAIKHEIQSIDSINGNQQLSTVQFDVKDAKIYGINYIDNSGEKQGCIICHSSIGSIERWIYAVLEEALKKERPELPIWLSPVQLRIIPVSNEKHLEFCKNLDFAGIRYDIDDRDEKVGRKIVRARQEWIPYSIVIGDNELSCENLVVNIRALNEQKIMKKQELIELIKSNCRDMPYRPIAMNKYLSKRPSFVGSL
jgi:threonyl-tRNA synthetase